MPAIVPTSAEFADHEARIKALELAVFGTPNPTPVPEMPANLQAVAGDGVVTLSWNASAGATHYFVFRNAALIQMTTQIGYADGGLVNGQEYFYSVSAANPSGKSPFAQTSATPTGGTPDPGWEHVTSDMGDTFVVDGRNVVIDGNAQVGTLHIRNGGTVELRGKLGIKPVALLPLDLGMGVEPEMNRGVLTYGGGEFHAEGSNVLPDENNLARDIGVYSIDPSQRGHFIVAYGGCAELRGAEFLNLGRGTLDPWNTTDNIKGRHSGIHFHHADPNCCVAEYCSIYDTGTPTRYGITVHGCNGVTVQFNVVKGKSGAGIWTEDGTERSCTITDNLTVGIVGEALRANDREELADFAFDGTGLWFRSGGNTVARNTIRGCRRGLIFWPVGGVPFTAADMLIEDCRVGIEPWFAFAPIGQWGQLDRVTVRRCIQGVQNYNVARLRYNDLTIEDSTEYGYNGGDYSEESVEFNRLVIRGTTEGPGLFPSTIQTAWTGTTGPLVVNGYIGENNRDGDIYMVPPYHNAGGSVCLPREITINQFDGRSKSRIVMDGVGRDGWNKVISDKLTVNGKRVFYVGQTADAICPATSGSNVGCPEAGLTNEVALAKYKVCRSGEIAPKEAVPVAGIDGGLIV